MLSSSRQRRKEPSSEEKEPKGEPVTDWLETKQTVSTPVASGATPHTEAQEFLEGKSRGRWESAPCGVHQIAPSL
jgi:hypothetical protein